MATVSQFTRPAQRRIIRSVLRTEQLPNSTSLTGGLGGFFMRGHQQEMQWVITNEDIATDASGPAHRVNDDNGEVVEGEEVEVTNTFFTTVWLGVVCSVVRVRGQLRITDAYTAKTLLCTADENVTPGTASFSATVISELDGYFGKGSITADNVFMQTIGVGEEVYAKWDEDFQRWIAFRPGSGEGGTDGMPTPGCGINNNMGIWEVDPDDLAGEGLIAATGTGTSLCAIDVNPGCGIKIEDDKVAVDYGCGLICSLATDEKLEVDISAIAGDGLIADIENCEIDVDPGCGIEVVAGKVQVKYGAGLNCVDGTLIATGIDLIAGCGIIVSGSGTDTAIIFVDNVALAGHGLVPATGTDCALDVSIGCGLEFNQIGFNPEYIRVNRTDLMGLGLEAGSGECEIQVNLGCGLVFGIEGIELDTDLIAGNGLTVTSPCVLNVGEGCGISVGGGAVSVDASQLAGIGLVQAAGTDCQIDVNYGCGLTISGDVLIVDTSALVGDAASTGLIESAGTGDCAISVDLESVLQVQSDKLISCNLALVDDNLVFTLNYNRVTFDINAAGDVIGASEAGSTFFQCSVMVEPCVIEGGDATTVSAGFATTVTPSLPDYNVAVNSNALKGEGITVNPGGTLRIGQGTGITVNANDVTVNAGAGLTFSGSALIVGQGNGITVNADDITVNAGPGLTFSGSALAVGAGCGISVAADSVAVDAAQLAGAGLFVSSGCVLAVGAGNGVTVNANDITVRAGAGLTFSAGDLVVGQGCGIAVSADAIAVDASQLAGAGLIVSSGCTLALSPGCGLELVGDVLQVKYGTGLTCINGELQATGTTLTAGCGVTIASGIVSVNHVSLAGNGLVAGTGCQLDIGAGCGITVSANSVSVNHTALAGNGLVAGTSCFLDVNPGLGIEVTTDQVRFKASDAAGPGLTGSGAVLTIGAGCGIVVGADNVSVNAASLAGAGLFSLTPCSVNVGAGCGITVGTDDISVKTDATKGLTCNVTTGLQIKAGACLIFDASGNLTLDPACQGQTYTAGCGLTLGGNIFSVNAATLAGAGLFSSLPCGINIGAGCGIIVDANSIRVDHTQLAGNGLSAGALGCRLDVNLSCGLELDGDAIKVKNTDLKGNGLITSGACGLAVGEGCGITVTTNGVHVNAAAIAGAGLFATPACGINVGAGCGITVGTDTVSVNRTALIGQGLAADSGTCNIKVKLSTDNSCLIFDALGAVKFDPACGSGTTLTAGCGISIVSNVVSVNAATLAGNGLVVSSGCTIAVNPGCGITIVDDQVRVDGFAIAGPGLTAVGGSSCAIQVNPGCGIEVISDQVRVKASDLVGVASVTALTTDGTCGIKVNLATASEFTLNAINSTGHTLVLNTSLNQLELTLSVTPWLVRRNSALMPTLLSPGAPTTLAKIVVPVEPCPVP